MTTILFKDLTDDQVIDLIDENVPFNLIPNFRTVASREWWTTDIKTPTGRELVNLKVRDLTFDLVTDKKTLKQILKEVKFNQLTIFQLNKMPADSLKTDELPRHQFDKILIQNGLVHVISVDFEFVKLSSISEEYLNSFRDKYSTSEVE